MSANDLDVFGPAPLFERTPAELVDEAGGIVEAAKSEHSPGLTFVLFSGGQDSVVLLDAVARHANAVVHTITGIGVQQTLQFVREVTASYNLPTSRHTSMSSRESWVGCPAPACMAS
jgi:3'-phosphoadenosine 5'-phosphosulfate sulfotransferase (PAPS reductase)/FAD synthetase